VCKLVGVSLCRLLDELKRLQRKSVNISLSSLVAQTEGKLGVLKPPLLYFFMLGSSPNPNWIVTILQNSCYEKRATFNINTSHSGAKKYLVSH